MLFETESFSVMSLFKGYGDNNVDGPNQYGSLRYTGLNKIPTISECFPYWKNAFPNLPVPSSIKETEPSKIWFLNLKVMKNPSNLFEHFSCLFFWTKS